MDADFLLADTVADGVDRVSAHAQCDGLLPVGEAAVAVCEDGKALPVRLDQNRLLSHTHAHTNRVKINYVETHTHDRSHSSNVDTSE